MLILCSHLLGAVMFNSCFNHNIALITTNCFMLTGGLVARKVLLKHFLFTTEVDTLDGGVTALSLMSFQVQILNDFTAPFLSVLTASLDHGELFDEERVRINQLE